VILFRRVGVNEWPIIASQQIYAFISHTLTILECSSPLEQTRLSNDDCLENRGKTILSVSV